MAKLYAPESYWKYDRANLEEVINGCGPSGWKSRLVPDSILGVSIKVACEIHDFMYFFGENEEDREEADRTFLNNMLRIVEAESAWFGSKWARRRLVLYYYSSVRDFGGRYFWDDKNSEAEFKEISKA